MSKDAVLSCGMEKKVKAELDHGSLEVDTIGYLVEHLEVEELLDPYTNHVVSF